jgi:hypothetical protein
MNDDELLEMLGDVARGERDADPQTEEAQALLRPLGDDAKARFADAIMASIGPPVAEPAPEPERPADREVVEAKIIPFPRRVMIWALPIAAAAAIAVVMLRPTSSPFTAYQLDASAGEQRLRSGNAAPAPGLPKYADGSGLELVLRPQTRVDAPVAVRAFWMQGERIESWGPAIDAAAGGAFRINGEAGALLPGLRGEVELLFAVGPEATLPTTTDALRAALEKPPESWRLLRYRLMRE